VQFGTDTQSIVANATSSKSLTFTVPSRLSGNLPKCLNEVPAYLLPVPSPVDVVPGDYDVQVVTYNNTSELITAFSNPVKFTVTGDAEHGTTLDSNW